MAIPQNRTSISTKRIHRSSWRKTTFLAARKAFSLAKSISTRHSKSFFVQQRRKKNWTNLNPYGAKKNVIFLKMNDLY